MAVILPNNAETTLATAINASETALVVADGSVFPSLSAGQHFYATLVSQQGTLEIVKVTARTGNVLTVTRGAESTTPNGFAVGTKVEARVTAASVEDGIDELRADLADSSGASLVGYTQGGSGVSARTVQDKLRETVSVKDFGAVGDGTTDDTAAVQAASDAAHTNDVINFILHFPKGTYRLTSTVDLRRCQIDASEATFNVDHTGIGLLLGGRAQNGNNARQHVYSVVRLQGVSDSTTPTVRIIGAKVQHITIDNASYIQLYADSDNSNADGSIAYSTFIFKTCSTVELTTNPTPVGSSIQWINENVFYLNRCYNFLVNGTYSHNFNRIYGGTFEGVGEINLQTGNSNSFYDIRGEGNNCAFIFGSGTYGNSIEVGYYSSPPGLLGLEAGIFPNNRSVTDNGVSNFVSYKNAMKYTTETIYSVDQYTKCFSGTDANENTSIAGMALSRNGIETFKVAGSFRLLHDVFIPVRKNTIVGFAAEQSAYRPLFSAYDADKNLLGATGLQAFGGMSSVTGGINFYTPVDGVAYSGSNSDASAVLVADSDVAYVRVITRIGSVNPAFITRLSLFVIRPITGVDTTKVFGDLSSIPVVSSSPTVGFAPIGEKVSDAAGGWYTAIFALDTVTDASASAAATAISVDSATGVSPSDIVGIEYEQNRAQWTSVASVVGTTINLNDALTNDVPSGARVVFNRWTNS